MARTLAVMLLAGAVAACVMPVPRLPDARSVAISVLDDRDYDTALPGDHWIPESQVVVGGRSGATTAGGILGGLVGMAIGMAIDRSRNEASLMNTANALTLKFDRRVFEDIATRMLSDPASGMKLVRADDPQAQVQLAPFARFQSTDDAAPLLTYTLQARMGERNRNGYSQRKTYVMQSPDRRPFAGAGGWGEAQGGASFDAASTIAFRRLVEAFMLDLRGELALPQPGAESRNIRWQATSFKGEPVVGDAVVLREMPGYVIAAPFGKGAPSRYTILVVDRALLRD